MSGGKTATPVPHTPEAWLREIAAAYLDAEETIPFGPAVGIEIRKKDLFHFAPAVCITRRIG